VLSESLELGASTLMAGALPRGKLSIQGGVTASSDAGLA
jgi:hypothetical protein